MGYNKCKKQHGLCISELKSLEKCISYQEKTKSIGKEHIAKITTKIEEIRKILEDNTKQSPNNCSSIILIILLFIFIIFVSYNILLLILRPEIFIALIVFQRILQSDEDKATNKKWNIIGLPFIMWVANYLDC